MTRSRTRKRRITRVPAADATYSQGYDSAYNEGYNSGFAKGFEDGHQISYEQQP
ncbi:hypothetical protein ACFOQM_21545 [Paenibacillus sp. GCM10012307]|uniref:Flagellar assembly protein H n=1 Tax=Paenibacillus roseus TaxID=2798579 RepID=A0A934JBK6_9BACL|nr:hypothetical protein [Paenibacillus roseus]MBJ6363815.1 hypothetical protein [Paenibacillus roseus]